MELDHKGRVSSSGIWRRLVRWVAPDVSEERIASIFRVEEVVQQTSEQAGGKQNARQSEDRYI
jgi:hypothetical protein